jgi:hypothetical protein
MKLTGGGSNPARLRASNNRYGKKAADMASEPICITCNLERMLISIKPGRNRHDVRAYECPACRDVFRLVVPREPLEADDLIDEVSKQAGAR